MAECLVLQRAFATFVAHGAIKGVISKQQFEHAFLCFLYLLSFSSHNLTLGNWCHARHHHHRATRSFDFYQTLTAHTGRCHAWVIAKTRNEFICFVGSRNDEVAFTCGHRLAVNGEADSVWIDGCCVRWINSGHCATPTAVTGIVMRLVTRASNSLRNNVSAE